MSPKWLIAFDPTHTELRFGGWEFKVYEDEITIIARPKNDEGEIFLYDTPSGRGKDKRSPRTSEHRR